LPYEHRTHVHDRSGLIRLYRGRGSFPLSSRRTFWLFHLPAFLRFIDAKPGKRSLNFVRKLIEQGHASARPYLRNGKVYHLFARNLYEAIGKDNVRFRRKHSTEYIRTRLAALDFILGRLDWRFLESESEKVRLFTEQLGIDKKYLPSKRIVLCADRGHELPVFRAAKTEIIDMIGHLACSMR